MDSNEIKSFIAQAREKGLVDDVIRDALIEKGWKKTAIDLAMAGVEIAVPAPGTAAMPHSAPEHHQDRPSLSPLASALHHVILWFFTSSSTIAIGGVVSSFYYGSGVSGPALASMMAVTIITFIPYAVLYAIYLVKNRATPFLTPNKIWSIITICLHSIGAMTAAIVAAIALITSTIDAVAVSSLLILLLNVIVLITYSFAAFGSKTLPRLRMTMLWVHLPVLLVLFGTLFTMSLLKMGPANADERLRKDLVGSVREVVRITKDKNQLPEPQQVSLKNGITYEKTGDKSYTLCGILQTSPYSPSSDEYADYYSDSFNERAKSDVYVYESDFYNRGTGKVCFKFTSKHLTPEDADLY